MRMVHVGHMRMAMGQWLVTMPMRVADARWVASRVAVLMMFVMPMGVIVFHRFVDVLMVVHFGQMQPDPGRHQHASGQQLESYRFAQEHYGGERTDERCGREICAGSCGPEMTQRAHEQRQADPIAKKADEHRHANCRP